MSTFVESYLDLGVDYGAVGGPEHSTTVQTTDNGSEYRIQNWSQPRHRYDIGERTVTQAQLDAIKDLFWLVRGRALGFRFRDWSDYRIAPADQYTRGALGVGDGVTTTFACRKKYGTSSYRAIVKLSLTTAPIFYVNGVVETHVTYSTTTGVVTFQPGHVPGVGALIGWSGEFDVPVRFDAPQIRARFEALDSQSHTTLFHLFSLPLIEVNPTL